MSPNGDIRWLSAYVNKPEMSPYADTCRLSTYGYKNLMRRRMRRLQGLRSWRLCSAGLPGGAAVDLEH